MKTVSAWLNKNIIGFSLASFFSDLGHEMATAVLPSFLLQLVGAGKAPQILGIITGVSDACASITKPFFGMLSDRLTYRKPLLIAGYTATALFIALIGFAHSVTLILLLRTAAWLGRGMREPARDALIAESIDRHYYGRAFGFHRAMDTAGAILGPLIAFVLIPLVSTPTIFFITLIPGIASVAAIIYFTSEVEHKTFSKMGLTGWLLQLKQLPASFHYFVLVMFIFGCGNFNKTMLILYAQEHHVHFGAVHAASVGVLLYALFNVSRAISEYSLGALSDRIGRKIPLGLFGFIFFGIISLLMMVNIISWQFLMLLFILNGISTAAVTAIEKAYAADLLPAGMRGTGFGLLQMADGIGDFIASFVVGTLWSTIGGWLGFLYAALLSFAAAGMLFMTKK